MTTHIDYEILTHKLKNPVQATAIPPVDIAMLEKKFVESIPRYRLPTTSGLLKGMNIDQEDILKFKEKYWTRPSARGRNSS